MLHSGHVAFFEEAASYGDLYVGIGSDKTLYELKARKPINTDAERLYMVKSLRMVKDAWINSGSGLLDFEKELRQLKPDIFFVNSDGHTPLKEKLCRDLGIEYIVSKRIPHGTLPARSTTMLRQECRIPYRIDLAGGWLDQPYVSKYYPGPVLTICIEPDYEFNDRSGMSTSSRKKAIELWQTDIPEGDKEKLAKTLFCYENPPGTPYISGSQDSLGIVMPGLNKYEYNGEYWPESIESVLEDDILSWIEKVIWLLPLYPRADPHPADSYHSARLRAHLLPRHLLRHRRHRDLHLRHRREDALREHRDHRHGAFRGHGGSRREQVSGFLVCLRAADPARLSQPQPLLL